MTRKELAKFDALRIEMDELDKRRLRQIEELRATTDRLRAENEELRGHAQELLAVAKVDNANAARLIEHVKEVAASSARLGEALRTYGVHLWDCKVRLKREWKHDDPDCTCGFSEFLK